MKRTPEPELMIDPEQVLAYGRADFEEPHSNFIKLLHRCCPSPDQRKSVLDAGCGAGDITFRIAGALPGAVIDAVDGSGAMIDFAKKRLGESPGPDERVRFFQSMIQDFWGEREYDLIISNSLLHHLKVPEVFWEMIKRLSSEGTYIFVMDLLRPQDVNEAKSLVELYSSSEPEILKRDFYNSLLSAFETDEIKEQLTGADLSHLEVERVSDRHFIVYGEM
ncbi:MAG: class I SAM-dependent methyltransferase [Deltaproteobacteria bacterium]